MLSRSSTSSPDILGPTGDSDYLISSPVRPFRGRQMTMSPSNLKVLQTPGTVKGKAPRFSLSPSKSAHSIRFDDVLLPVSPHIKMNAAQRALSPAKGQLDGNQSPWRIRVTLEATQDEDEAQGSPARKRARQSTMTTKIPLKDESEQTPRRRRGRPRKSDAIEPTATPTPAPAAGSPGNTPGPAGHTPGPAGHTPGLAGHTPGPAGTSGQKRKRGRPRKSQLQIEATETNEQIPEEQVEDSHAQDQQADIQAIELPAEEPTPLAEPRRSWSPLDIAGDNEDDFDDELPDAPDPFDFAGQTEELGDANLPRSSPRVTFDTPNVDTIDDAYLRIGEPNLDSTPSKMPSPPREDHGSPENSLHAGRTPMPPRRYPTPNSSSQMGDERQDRPGAVTTVLENRENVAPVPTDPTDEHREFDSIMESEGFSMVSLDTLPSAKQHGLSTSSDLRAKKGSLKPFMEREITTSSKRKSRFTRDEVNNDQNAQESSPAVIERHQSHSRVHSNTSNPSLFYPSLHKQHSSPREVPPSSTSATAAPTPLAVPIKQRPLDKLVKLVRVGIVLGDVLFNSYELPPAADLYAHQGQDPDLEAPSRRLERLFSDFKPEIQHRLQVGLDFAYEIARLRILDEIDGEIEAREAIPSPPRTRERREADVPTTSGELGDIDRTPRHRAADVPATSPELGDMDRTPYESPSSEMKRRMAEWQQERDAISREIQQANSSQVIVIDSDGNGPTPDNRGNYYDEGHYNEGTYDEEGFDSDQDSVSVLEQPLYPEVPQTDEPADDMAAEEEDGYEDIWQQEAHDLGSPSDRSSLGANDQNGDQHGPESSPWKGTDRGKSSPASWTNENNKVPFLGPSRVGQLREQDADLSGLLNAKQTPKRSRYYYGKSSPFSTATGRSPERSPEQYQTTEPEIEETEAEAQDEYGEERYGEEEEVDEAAYHFEQDFGPADYLETSPQRGSEDDFQIDPTTRFENSMQQPDSPAGGSEDGSIGYVAQAEPPSAHQTVDLTPQRPQAESADAPPSSWFQRIASLTPGWLKAPNRKKYEEVEPSVEGDHSDYGHEEPIPSKEPSYTEEDTPRPVENGDWEETPRPPRRSSASTQERRSSFQPSSGQRSRGSRDARFSSGVKTNGHAYDRPPPLSVSGYFSDEHYYLLRRLYRAAIKLPERFPYYPASGRSDIIGDWIWTSDGTYGVPITERQFAIIDRFVQVLARADIQAGGTGQVSWTEADLHRRLISIIIGEQIRTETKEQQQAAEQATAEAETSTIRGLTRRLWR